MLGELPYSGNGTQLDANGEKSIGQLRGACRSRNSKLLKTLKEDDHGVDLLAITRDDAKKGRMSWPVPAAGVEVGEMLLHPRFAVEQTRADGSIKLRAIDHLSWSTDVDEVGPYVHTDGMC